MRQRMSSIKLSQDILLIPLLLVGVGVVAVDLVAAHTNHAPPTEYSIAPITTVPPRTFQLLLPPNLPATTTALPAERIVAHHPAAATVSPHVTTTVTTEGAAGLALAARRPAPTSTVTTSTTVRRGPPAVDPPPVIVKLVPTIVNLPRFAVPTPAASTTVPSHPVAHVRVPHPLHGRRQHGPRGSKQQIRRHS